MASTGNLSPGHNDSIKTFQISNPNPAPEILKGSSSQHLTNSQHDELEETPVECDYFESVYEYINRMLMEEDDLDYRPCMFQDYSALQATEKYFSEALSEKDQPTPLDPSQFSVNDSSRLDSQIFREDLWITDPLTGSYDFDCLVNSPQNYLVPINEKLKIMEGNCKSGTNNLFGNQSVKKKSRDRCENEDSVETSSKKQLAGYTEDSEPMEKYDKSLLCPQMNPNFYGNPPDSYSEEASDEEDKIYKQFRESKEVKRGRPKGSKKNAKVREVVDLTNLLTRCARAVSTSNISPAEDFLKMIRQYSSPYGDANERLAHYFANALESRIAGTGSALYTASASRRIPAGELLKSYQSYVMSCPFKRMSNVLANKTIGRYTREAKKIHIIDFGILYGFQWPCIIHGVSLRPGGPPMLKITGIDFPQSGFKPDERVEQTGQRLMNVCERFNVSFDYNAIAKRWDDIHVEDLNIERDGMVVVNCLYRLRHMPDESARVSSPRETVLKLIKEINPNLFVHGVVNGTYNAPFFETRFREALFHFSSFFDMLESTLPREDHDRFLYEKEVFGRDVMNVIACEGSERVERPETYKKWHVRNQRAGFQQIPLSPEILKEVHIKVLKGYHNDFLLDEDSGWMLQGWKGRVMYALSFWKPSQE